MENATPAMARQMMERALENNNVQDRVINDNLEARDAQRYISLYYQNKITTLKNHQHKIT